MSTKVDETEFISTFSSPRLKNTCKSSVCKVLKDVTPEMSQSLRQALENRYHQSENPNGWTNKDISDELTKYNYNVSASSIKQWRQSGCVCTRSAQR